jgi:hypothetical protein
MRSLSFLALVLLMTTTGVNGFSVAGPRTTLATTQRCAAAAEYVPLEGEGKINLKARDFR